MSFHDFLTAGTRGEQEQEYEHERGFPASYLSQIPKLKIVLVLDRLGLCVETRPESSRAISLR
jgi:hypothetical protein